MKKQKTIVLHIYNISDEPPGSFSCKRVDENAGIPFHNDLRTFQELWKNK